MAEYSQNFILQNWEKNCGYVWVCVRDFNFLVQQIQRAQERQTEFGDGYFMTRSAFSRLMSSTMRQIDKKPSRIAFHTLRKTRPSTNLALLVRAHFKQAENRLSDQHRRASCQFRRSSRRTFPVEYFPLCARVCVYVRITHEPRAERPEYYTITMGHVRRLV